MKKEGCSPCKRKALEKYRLLKNALVNGMIFEEAVLYAGLPTNNLKKVLKRLSKYLNDDERGEIISNIDWGE